MIKLSIIVPIYNAEKFLRKCIDSLINQRLKEIEIILINDGSKDRSDEICNELSTMYKNIKYFKIENFGCSFARNYGINKSIGEYITFVDADDWVDKDMYIEMYQKSKAENLDILICGYSRINEKGQIIEEVLPQLKNTNDYIKLDSEWFNCPWNKIYKRDLVIKNKIEFLKNCHMGEDMVFNVKAFRVAEKISLVKKSYYNYFINENSVTFNPNKKIEIFHAIKEIKNIGISFQKLDECIRRHGVDNTFGTLEFLKEKKMNWEFYYKQYLEELSYLKQDISFKTNRKLAYRKLRLKFLFLKKYLIFLKIFKGGV